MASPCVMKILERTTASGTGNAERFEYQVDLLIHFWLSILYDSTIKVVKYFPIHSLVTLRMYIAIDPI